MQTEEAPSQGIPTDGKKGAADVRMFASRLFKGVTSQAVTCSRLAKKTAHCAKRVASAHAIPTDTRQGLLL